MKGVFISIGTLVVAVEAEAVFKVVIEVVALVFLLFLNALHNIYHLGPVPISDDRA